MAFKDGSKSGGRRVGSCNKKTLIRLEQIKKAAEAIANPDGSKVFDGDAHALLSAIYKNEDVPLQLRADCAKAAIRFERPALEVVNSTINDQRNYIVRMPGTG